MCNSTQDPEIRHAYSDITRGFEEGNFTIETPRGSIDEVGGLTISIENIDRKPYLRLELDVALGEYFDEVARVSRDLGDFDSDVYVYGALHVWRLHDRWGGSVQLNAQQGEHVVAEHNHEFLEVECVGWN